MKGDGKLNYQKGDMDIEIFTSCKKSCVRWKECRRIKFRKRSCFGFVDSNKGVCRQSFLGRGGCGNEDFYREFQMNWGEGLLEEGRIFWKNE